MKKKLKKKITITYPLMGDNVNATNVTLIKAAKLVMKDINKHFHPKLKHGWPLDFTSLKEDVFYNAFGHHLEAYLINELIKSKKYMIQSSLNVEGRLCVALIKKGKKKK